MNLSFIRIKSTETPYVTPGSWKESTLELKVKASKSEINRIYRAITKTIGEHHPEKKESVIE